MNAIFNFVITDYPSLVQARRKPFYVRRIEEEKYIQEFRHAKEIRRFKRVSMRIWHPYSHPSEGNDTSRRFHSMLRYLAINQMKYSPWWRGINRPV
jgi:hypothetical protein